MININKIDEIKNEVENYKNLKWYKSFRGLSVIMLVLVFFLTSWHRFFFSTFYLADYLLCQKRKSSSHGSCWNVLYIFDFCK